MTVNRDCTATCAAILVEFFPSELIQKRIRIFMYREYMEASSKCQYKMRHFQWDRKNLQPSVKWVEILCFYVCTYVHTKLASSVLT